MKIPHLPRLPIIGNLHQIAGKDIMGRLIKATEDFRPICELKVFGIKFLIINDVDLAKEVLDEERFDKFIDLPIEHLRKVAGDGLFTAWTYEENWQKAHNILLPGFAHKAIQSYIPIMQDSIDQLMEKWLGMQNQWIDVTEDMTRLTFEVIGRCGFDYSFGTFTSEKRHPFVDSMLFAFNEAIQLARTPAFLQPLRVRRNRLFNQHIDYMNNLLDEIIKKRRAEASDNADKIDFLQLMLHSKDKKTGTYLSDENIRHQIVTFLVAGHETTSSLLAFAIYNLLTNKDALAKVYEEVDRVLGDDYDRQLGQNEFRELKYVRQLLMESLRLHPPVPGITRYSTVDTTIGKEQYPIKANQSIMVFSYHMHRDQKHWGPSPDTFNPAHFSAEAISSRDREAFMAFGSGQRSCIGRHFAMLESCLTLAKIFQRFELRLEPGYQLQLLESPAMKPKGLRISIKERKMASSKA